MFIFTHSPTFKIVFQVVASAYLLGLADASGDNLIKSMTESRSIETPCGSLESLMFRAFLDVDWSLNGIRVALSCAATLAFPGVLWLLVKHNRPDEAPMRLHHLKWERNLRHRLRRAALALGNIQQNTERAAPLTDELNSLSAVLPLPLGDKNANGEVQKLLINLWLSDTDEDTFNLHEVPSDKQAVLSCRLTRIIGKAMPPRSHFSAYSFLGTQNCPREFTRAYLRQKFPHPMHHADVIVQGWKLGRVVLRRATPLFMFCFGQSGHEFSVEELEAFLDNFFPKEKVSTVNPVHQVEFVPHQFESKLVPFTPYDIVLFQWCVTPPLKSSGTAKKALQLMEAAETTRTAFEDVFPLRLCTAAAALVVIVALVLIDAKFVSFPRTAVESNFLKEMATICVGRYMKDPRLLYNETIPVSLFNEMNPGCPLALQELLYLNRKVVNSLSIETSHFRSKQDILQAGTCESFSYVRALYFAVNSTHIPEEDKESRYTIFIEMALDWNVEPKPQYVRPDSLIRNDMTTHFSFRYWPHYDDDPTSTFATVVGTLSCLFLLLLLVRNCDNSAKAACTLFALVTVFMAFIYVLVAPGVASLHCCAFVALMSSILAMINDAYTLYEHDWWNADDLVISKRRLSTFMKCCGQTSATNGIRNWDLPQNRQQFNDTFKFPWSGAQITSRIAYVFLEFILSMTCARLVALTFQLTSLPLNTWKDADYIVLLKHLIDVAVYLAGFIALAHVSLMTNVRLMYGILTAIGLLSTFCAVVTLFVVNSMPTQKTFLTTIIANDTSIAAAILLGCVYRCRSARQKPVVEIEKRLEVAYKLDCSISTALHRPRNAFTCIIFFIAFTMLAVLTVGLVFYRAMHQLPGPDRSDLTAEFTAGTPILMKIQALLLG